MKLTRRDVALAIMGSAAVVVPTTATAGERVAPNAAAIDPKHAAGMVRANLMESIANQIKHFTRDASIGDLFLLDQVLSSHDGCSLGITAETPELQLPEAFAEHLGI